MANDLVFALRIKEDGSATVARSLRGVGDAAGKLGDEAKNASGSVAALGGGLQSMALSIVGLVSTRALLGLSRDMAQASDAMRSMQVQMARLAGRQSGLGVVIDLADELGSSLRDTADAMNFFAPTFTKMGRGFGEAAGFVADLNKSMRLYGVEGEAAVSITTQLAQAFGSGQLAGDELKSLSENAAGLYVELEQVIKGILGTREPLKNLGAQGKITSEVLLDGFQKVFGRIRGEFESLPDSLSQQEGRLANAWQSLLDGMDDQLHASEWWQAFTGGLADAANAMAASLGSLTVPTDALLDRLVEVERLIERSRSGVLGYLGVFARGTGEDELKREKEKILQELYGRQQARNAPAPGTSGGAAGAGSQADLKANARAIVLAAEQSAGLPPGSLLALWGVESSYSLNMGITSPAGAKTPFQIMPSTGRALGIDVNTATFEESAKAGAVYLKQGLDAYGNLGDAYRFYHGGPDTRQWGPKTNAYANKAQSIRGAYLSEARLPDQEAYAATLERQKLLLEGNAERERVLADVRAEGARVTASVRTESEQYAAEMQHVAWLYNAKAISAETLQRRTKELWTEYDGAADKAQDLKDTAKDLGMTFSSAFEDAIVGGKNLSDVLKGLAQDVLRVFVRQSVTKPVAEGLSGFFGDMFGEMFATGGTPTAALSAGIYDRPITFAMAGSGVRRFASGGVGMLGERYQPEAVLPLRRGADGTMGVSAAQPSCNITVNNLPGQDAQIRDDGRGGLTMDIVRAELAADAHRGGVEWDRAFADAYGLGRGR